MPIFSMQLTPDQLKDIPSYEETANPSFTKNLSDVEMASGDFDDPDDVKRQQEGQIFDGSTYKPVGNDVPNSEENAKFNDEVYNSTGEKVNLPFGLSFRTQQVTNPDGSTEKQIVPDQGSPYLSKQGNDALQTFDRTVGGMGLQAAKGALSFGEWAMDNTPVANQLGSLLLGPGVGDKETNWVNANFPTMPAQNDAERVIQEVGSVVLGAVGGGTLAADITKLPKVEQGLAWAADKFLRDAQRVDPANAAQKMQAFLRAAVIERSADLGASVTTPEHSGSLTGTLVNAADPSISEKTAEQFPGINQEKVGVFTDNVLGSALLNTFGRVLKGGVKKVAGTVFEKTPTKPAELAEKLFRQVDPNLENTSPEEFARRARIFQDVMQDAKESASGEFGTYTRGPVSAATAGAAKKYVEEAYSFMKPNMAPAEWDAFVAKNSQLIADGLAAARRDNLSSTIVQAADAQVNDQARRAMLTAADTYANFGGIQKAGEALGQGVIDQKQAATDLLATAKGNADNAAVALENANSKNFIIQKFEEMKKNGSLANSTDPERAQLERLTGPEFYNQWKKSYDAYNQAFANLPNGIPFDKEAFVDRVIAAGDGESISDLLGLKGTGNLVKAAPTDPEAREAYRETLLQGLQDKDLKWLYTQARPHFADMLNSAASPSGGLGLETKGIQDLKGFIDQAANETGDSRFTSAMSLYKDHQNKFGQITDLANYDTSARNVANSETPTSMGKKQEDLYITGKQLLDNATTSNNSTYIQNVVAALQAHNPRDIGKELGDMVVGMAVKGLADSKGPGGTLASKDIQNAMQRYLPFLKETNPESYQLYHETVDALQAAEMGSKEAEQRLLEATAKSQAMVTEANKSAANKFLADMGNIKGEHPKVDMTKAFNDIFKDADQTDDIMLRAKAEGNQQVIDGIQSQYLRYLADRFFTTRPISAGGDGTFVREASGSKVDQFFEGSDTTGRTVAEIVFKDKPQTLNDLYTLLSEVHLDNMSRQLRPQPFSSNTAVDNTRQRNMSLVIAAVWGRLNKTATTIGAFSSAITSKMTAADQAKVDAIIPNLITNIDYLSSALDQLGDNPPKDAIDAIANIIAKPNPSALGRGVIAPLRSEQYNSNLDQQTQEAFGQTPNSGKPQGPVQVKSFTGSDGIKHDVE